jgi:hypothetical protein
MELASMLRTLGLVAGPATVVALGLLVAGLVIEGEAGIDTSPLAVASSAFLLVALLGIGATAVAVLARLKADDRPTTGAALAVVGTVLVAGGAWAALFVLPGLAKEAPDVLDSGLASVIVGYIASYAVFSVGWVWAAVAMIRARLVPTGLAVLVAVGGVLAFVPSPEASRLLVIAVGTSLVARRLVAPVATPARVAA